LNGMEKKQLERNEIPERFKWDLTPLYSRDDEWELDFGRIDAALADFNAYQGKLAESADSLRRAFEKSDVLSRLVEKLYTYAHLKSDEDVADSGNLGRMGRIAAKYAEIGGSTAWFEPEMLAIPQKELDAFLASGKLDFYRRSIEETLRDKPHTLGAAEERVLGMASDAFSTPHQVFSALNDADAKFPAVKDGEGREVELTHGNYQLFLETRKRDVRKTAFHAMHGFYEAHRNSIAAVLNGTVKTHILNSKLRSFPSALEASLHSDNVPLGVYDNLISSVREGLDVLERYFDLRKKRLDLECLDMFDLRAPIVGEVDRRFSWDEAVEMVLESLSPLGDEYAETAARAFSERWVDSRESRGKRSGAYSSGCYDSPPYILMNFNGTLNDVFTLAHELGHSMHSFLSRSEQEYHYADYGIFVAEVASTANEMLLHRHLTDTSDDKEFKAYLAGHLLDTIRGTLYRQTMFAEFEKNIHGQLEKGEPLTADSLSEAYYALNADYHPGIDADSAIAMEWARIPHFHYNFYVYKYATGISASAALVKGLLGGGNAEREAYLGFLKAGSTKDVLDILCDAGVDLESPEPVKAAISLFDDTLAELEKR